MNLNKVAKIKQEREVRKMKILIADSENPFRDTLFDWLGEAGHEVLCACDADMALLILHENPDIGLIIASVIDADGKELLLRKKVAKLKTEIWLMSGIMNSIMQEEVLRLGANKGILRIHIVDELRKAGILPPSKQLQTT